MGRDKGIQRNSTNRNSVQGMRRWLQILVLVVLATILAGCGLLGGGEAGEDVATLPEGQEAVPALITPTLTCSAECAGRGQCGVSPDRGNVVLLNREGPTVNTAEHDFAIPENTAVDVLEVRTETVTEELTSLQFPVNFYRVFIPTRSDAGWVAAWCILNVE